MGLWEGGACAQDEDTRVGDGSCPFPVSSCGSSPSLLFQKPPVPVPASARPRWLVPSGSALQQLLEQKGTGKGARGPEDMAGWLGGFHSLMYVLEELTGV